MPGHSHSTPKKSIGTKLAPDHIVIADYIWAPFITG